MFGEYIREERIKKGLSLREFCKLMGEDASNWSKIERDKMAPPQDQEKLEKIAAILSIVKDSTEWKNLMDYAAIDAGKIPDYLRTDKEVMKALPVFLRTIGSIKPTPEELAALIDSIRKEG
jgi:transcriptional regulator with XRE-family HTH domain